MRFFVSFLFFSISINLFSQSIVIDLNKCANKTCNGFGPPRTCGLVPNLIQTIYGAPKFEKVPLIRNGKADTLNALRFRSFYQDPFNSLGDALGIKYEFKPTKYYRFDFVTSSMPGVNTSSGLRISLDKGNFSNSGCSIGSYNVPFSSYFFSTGSLTPQYLPANSNFNELFYTSSYNLFIPNDIYDFLGIRAVSQSGYDTLRSLLYKINIKEYDFKISPDKVNVTCNKPVDATLTVLNPDNIPIDPSTLSYVWNLGSNANGWIHNNAPAPQFITTSSNNILLTYDCGQNVSNDISVTVKVNGVVYDTYIVDINFNPPDPLTINGSNIICTSSQMGYLYSVPDFPCNANISWQIDFPGINLVPTGNDVMLYPQYPLNNSSGTLYAHISNGCTNMFIQHPLFFSTSDCACNLPTNLTATSNPGMTGVTLSWSPISGIQFYEIQYEFYDCIYGTYEEGVTGSLTNSYQFYYGAPGERVRYRVRAKCSFGFYNDYSSWHEFIIPASCGIPIGLNATQISGTLVNLSWQAVPNATSYQIYSKYNNGTGFIHNTPTVVGTNSYDFYSAPYGSQVEYSVKAICGNVYSAMSDCYQFTMSYPCPVINGGIATQSVGSGIYLYFPSSPPEVISFNLKYRIYGSTSEYIIYNIPTTSPYFFNVGIPGQLYQFAIQSVCANGSISDFGPWTITPTQYKLLAVEANYNDNNLWLGTEEVHFQLRPNPTHKDFSIQFFSLKSEIGTVNIFNALGICVESKQIHFTEGKGIYQFSTRNLKPGIYLVYVIKGNIRFSRKLILYP